LIEAGRDVGAGPVGSRALMSLRIEKGYGSWGREYSPEYWPQEVGLDRLCKLDKEFLNKSALLEVLQKPARERLVVLALDADATDASQADATGGEPIFKDGVGVGRVTSGAYGYCVGERVDVMVLGVPHGAVVLDQAPFDPAGARLRG
jgi:dimethylglycine dehydrogenase